MQLFPHVKRGWWLLLLYGLIAVAFGIVALVSPLATAVALAWAAGLMALIEGALSLAALFDKRLDFPRGWLVLYTIASLGFAAVALINPAQTAAVLLVLLAAWLIVAGIYRIIFAIRVRKEIEGEWLIALSGVLAIVLGALFAANPVAGLVVTTVWIGISALIYGVVQIVGAIRLRRLLA